MDKYDKARPAQEELKPSVEKLRELSSHLQIALEAERTRIAREIHDELGSTLAAIKMELSWLAKFMAKSRKFPAERAAAMIGHRMAGAGISEKDGDTLRTGNGCAGDGSGSVQRDFPHFSGNAH